MKLESLGINTKKIPSIRTSSVELETLTSSLDLESQTTKLETTNTKTTNAKTTNTNATNRNVTKPKATKLLRISMATFIIVVLLFFVNTLLASPVKRLDSGIATTWDEISSNYKQVLDLVNSIENKRIFGQLLSADHDFYDTGANVVGTSQLHQQNQYQHQPYVSNGFIGSRIPNLGQGFTYDQPVEGGKPTHLHSGYPIFNLRYAGAFVAGFYDSEGESYISAVPQWTTLQLSTTIDGKNYTLDPSLNSYGEISHYIQTMSLNNGVVTTEFVWLNTLRVKYEVIAHRKHVNLGVVKLSVNNLNDTEVSVIASDILSFATTQRCEFSEVGHDDDGIFISFHPRGARNIHGTIYSILSTNANSKTTKTTDATNVTQEVTFNLNPGDAMTLEKMVGIVTTDFDPKNLVSGSDVMEFAKKTALDHTHDDQIFTSHIDAWASTLEVTPTISFPDDPLLTLASRASLFHLSSNTRPDAQGLTAALGVGGLSSDSYAGMVFWDTDLWMLNGLLPFVPHHAKALVNYRLHLHDQAKANLPSGYHGAVYPWTSGRFGNCTGTGPCMNYEYHINVAIALAAWQIFLSGGGDESYLSNVAMPLMSDAAQFFSDYVQYNQTSGQYTTSDLTDPDEFANHIDNGAYTNAGIAKLMENVVAAATHLGQEIPSIFSNISDNMNLPSTRDNNASIQDIVLEYTGMNNSVAVKQADVIMITYPLDNKLISNEQAVNNMNYYAMKQVSYGPAMTFPIFSIVSATLAESGCASQSYLHKAVQPFLRAPFAQFSEQNNDDYDTNGGFNPAFPFLTGHGGFLQSVLQGLVGLRYDFDIIDGRIERLLTLDPITLPLFPQGVEFGGIHYMNQTISLKIDDKLTVHHQGPTNSNPAFATNITIQLGSRNPKAGTYTLTPGSRLEFPLFEVGAADNSMVQCGNAAFFNITDGVNGDSTFSINDGDNFTHWQSATNGTTKVLVDLKSMKTITGGGINWGDSPPERWSLSSYHGDAQDPQEILASVDFGNDLTSKLWYYRKGDVVDQESVFSKVLKEEVTPSAPWIDAVVIPEVFNTTTFSKEVKSRFLLLEYEGGEGGKLHEVEFW
ncbi:cell wall acid trehalase Atc1p [[Candida] jaroonii]|uniref:Cell wall acid trehalase Atc1p n=1 Tax=[Candida] jaroonii TaxID=467808 RepID=A0ACA9Y9G2_9ASCO|nr:cell wall acid trehalase Atc1p [[Candida] jaroonii]